MHYGSGPESCSFNSTCVRDATHWISKAKQYSCGPVSALKTQNESKFSTETLTPGALTEGSF